jgi:hypothetical protein
MLPFSTTKDERVTTELVAGELILKDLGEGAPVNGDPAPSPLVTKNDPAQLVFKSGAAGSKIPRYELIPYRAMDRIADRFEHGLAKHKEKSWNALSSQDCLSDREWVIARASHAIDHAKKLIAKLTGQAEWDEDDDAAAIAWAGVCLGEAVRMLREGAPRSIFSPLYERDRK